jgi:hypothetical protein
MKESYLIFIISISVLLTYAGYLAGKYQERKEWNKLIEQGKIPAPKK